MPGGTKGHLDTQAAGRPHDECLPQWLGSILGAQSRAGVSVRGRDMAASALREI